MKQGGTEDEDNDARTRDQECGCWYFQNGSAIRTGFTVSQLIFTKAGIAGFDRSARSRMSHPAMSQCFPSRLWGLSHLFAEPVTESIR